MVFLVDLIAAGGKVRTSQRPNPVGQEWIVAATSRERPLCHADKEDLVKFETDAQCDWTDDDTGTEAAVTAEVIGELKGKGLAKRSRRGSWIDSVEVSKPINGRFDSIRGVTFLCRPFAAQRVAAKVGTDQRVAPPSEAPPSRSLWPRVCLLYTSDAADD